jgi:hypothetical protein
VSYNYKNSQDGLGVVPLAIIIPAVIQAGASVTGVALQYITQKKRLKLETARLAIEQAAEEEGQVIEIGAEAQEVAKQEVAQATPPAPIVEKPKVEKLKGLSPIAWVLIGVGGTAAAVAIIKALKK